MSLKETLQQDLKTAMKEKDTIRKNVITMMRAGILQIEKDKKIELDDEGVLDVLNKGVKQRRDSIPEYEKGNRLDLVESIQREIDILLTYMPKQFSEDEVTKIIKDTIEEVGAKGVQDIGKIMPALMPKVKGKADGKLVNTIVRKLLEQ